MTAPTIGELKALQRERELTEHLVWLCEVGFVLAHTDGERENMPSLEDCPLHQWLIETGGPDDLGYFVVTRHEPDAVSESYRGDGCPWDFEPLVPAP